MWCCSVRGGLGVTVEESQGKILVKALPRDAWDEPNQVHACLGRPLSHHRV